MLSQLRETNKAFSFPNLSPDYTVPVFSFRKPHAFDLIYIFLGTYTCYMLYLFWNLPEIFTTDRSATNKQLI